MNGIILQILFCLNAIFIRIVPFCDPVVAFHILYYGELFLKCYSSYNKVLNMKLPK